MKRFTNHPEQWGTFVDVKYWEKIKNSTKYSGKELFIGSVTDPYMPLEEKYKRTRVLLEEMQGSGCKISIATKSDLVLRDIDLIKTFPEARVSWSINTLDEEFRSEMDNSVSIERKIEAMKKFHEEGIRTTCFISPNKIVCTCNTKTIYNVKRCTLCNNSRIYDTCVYWDRICRSQRTRIRTTSSRYG